MLTADQVQHASDLLYRHWHEGHVLSELPEDVRPTTREDGYHVQALLEHRSAAPLFGWKIAATSIAGQHHIGVDGPLAGRLLSERVQASGTIMPLNANRMLVAEPEFAFRMAHDLPPRSAAYLVADVMSAVGSLHPAIEVPDSRFEDFRAVGAPQLIADNACADRFVLGAAVTADWRGLDLSRHIVTATVSGEPPAHGTGSNVLGDPRLALTWLANELSGLGITLRAGQVVTTGTCMPPVAIHPGEHVEADFGPIGRVGVSFAP